MKHTMLQNFSYATKSPPPQNKISGAHNKYNFYDQ